MRKNQKLATTAAVALALSFGAYKVLNSSDNAQASTPVNPTDVVTREDRAERQRQMFLDAGEVPEKFKKVQNGLEDRWGFLDEEVLTAPSVDGNGEMVYFDKELKPGKNSDGETIWAQGAHRAYLFQGELLRTVKNKPITLTLAGGKKPGDGFFAKALQQGAEIDRSKAPSAKAPASEK